MKVTCSQEELARSLQIAGRGMSAKSTLPILSGMLLETRGDSLTILSTDLELGIEIKVPDTIVSVPGKAVIPGKTLIEIVRHLPPGKVEMSLNEEKGTFSIVSSSSSFQLHTLPVEEFPTLSESFRDLSQYVNEVNDSKKTLRGGSVLASDFKEAVRQCVYATSPEDPRPFLSSVLMEMGEERLRMVATDINRLVIRDISYSREGEVEEKILVPVRALKEVANIFGGDPEENIDITIEDRQLFFLGKGLIFSTRLVDAQFPRYEQVIPSEFVGTMQVNRLLLLEALERTSLVDNVVKLNLKKDVVEVFSNEPDLGNAYEEVACSFSGKEMQIGFNARFLMDFLRTVDKEEIIIKISGNMKASLMQGMGSENYRYVVMPMRLNV